MIPQSYPLRIINTGALKCIDSAIFLTPLTLTWYLSSLNGSFKMSTKTGDEASKPSPAPTQSVGPNYRPEKEKPRATVSKEPTQQNVTVLPQTPQLIALLT